MSAPSFFLNPQKQLKRGTYFATLKENDGAHDRSSHLDREGVFRLSMGISKKCYRALFQDLPARPTKGRCIAGDYDFERLDTLLPHPVYAWMGWVCVLNPSRQTFQQCKSLLEDAYEKASEITCKKLSK